MIDRYINRDWPPDLKQALKRFKQGDVIKRPPFFYGRHPTIELFVSGAEAGDSESQVHELHPDDAPPYGIITTQTCDLDEQGVPSQPWLQVSPVYALPSEDEAPLGKAYAVELTGADLPEGRWIADLRIELPLEKSVLQGRQPIAGFATEEQAEEFGRQLGARRARAALANELVETVIRLLSKRKANNKRRSARVWTELWRLGIQVEEGTRLKPVAVRLHVLCAGPVSESVRKWFESWEDAARLEADKVGISLHTTRCHDATSMDARLADRLIPVAV